MLLGQSMANRQNWAGSSISGPPSVSSWRETDFDNYVFIVHELFLYAVGILLRYERFETLAELLNVRFYSESDGAGEHMLPFAVLRKPMQPLTPKQQEMRRSSLRADLLEQRSHASGLRFADLMAGNFLLFLRSATSEVGSRAWFPETLVNAYSFHGRPFEIFARAESTVSPYRRTRRVLLLRR